MESLFSPIQWVPVLVSFLVAFGAGWYWYSDKLFGQVWRDGIGIDPEDQSTMKPAMIAQAIGTFLLAIVINVMAYSVTDGVLVALTLAVIIKANGLFSQKSHTAIKVESGYILVMVALMMLVNMMM
tara:strand:+ start:3479 stop:3856 length:378 start_codon:yes stop_codon:yes gene_type:complete